MEELDNLHDDLNEFPPTPEGCYDDLDFDDLYNIENKSDILSIKNVVEDNNFIRSGIRSPKVKSFSDKISKSQERINRRIK